jgi:hypothetical protein
MPKGTYIPNNTLISILKGQGDRSFRVTTIRDLFAKENNEERDSNEIRRWVNGQFKTLAKHGYIKIVSQDGVRTDYQITTKISGVVQCGTAPADIFDNKTPNLNVLNALKNRLRNCKMEMLTSSGETKEYEELSELFPQMRAQLQDKFNLAKEKNIEYMGRVNALELLIAEHG